MQTETSSQSNLKKHNPPGRPKHPRTNAIIKTAVTNPNLTLKEISDLHNCSEVNVWQTLERYGINQNELKHFQENEKTFWDAANQKSLVTYLKLNPDETKSMLLRRGLVDAAIASDKSLQARQGDKSTQPLVIINRLSINNNTVDQIIELPNNSNKP